MLHILIRYREIDLLRKGVLLLNGLPPPDGLLESFCTSSDSRTYIWCLLAPIQSLMVVIRRRLVVIPVSRLSGILGADPTKIHICEIKTGFEPKIENISPRIVLRDKLQRVWCSKSVGWRSRHHDNLQELRQ
jgi:hypothetical protein